MSYTVYSSCSDKLSIYRMQSQHTGPRSHFIWQEYKGQKKLKSHTGNIWFMLNTSMEFKHAQPSPTYSWPINSLISLHIALEAYIRTMEEGRYILLHLCAHTRQYICWNLLLQDSSLSRRSAETPSLLGLLETTRFLNFLFWVAHCWVSWTTECKSFQ